MEIKKILIALAFVSAPVVAQPPTTIPSEGTDEQDAEYEACKARYVRDGFGNYDQAAAWCYPRIYGSEDSPYPGKDPSIPKY
ncbi:hypothetical protein AX777_03275 [Sphingobium yanoikuyae]|jgi:hypothetical protein|uniref:Uncharacterized protein n=1 Tax=Sphingobium yanoikuyae TaxID=13690 RepID=A0A177J315_SPHYA|nr:MULTISPECIES: hypothetical protein [Sphingobium]PZU68457.1 MAG: hypothetical protein DI554_03175 [Sphingobium sp.]RSU76687.1 hypothetical protein BRX37_08940 [Sphingomonas sp. S-NIH.Pt3_0716]OAH35454.1 hypothetical protein AX777_03275 [Sphingobium yanoikuyae]QCB37940.1 hypothetical protein E5554_08925 [Sphingobium sp. PAMC28499]QJR01010.1 hypothetical protein HH800_01640 [Sphingobium yanoikuyae]